ncbi:MAG: SCO family protein [Ilumatobacteraceae bacterium]
MDDRLPVRGPVTRSRRPVIAAAIAASLVFAACGSDGADDDAGTSTGGDSPIVESVPDDRVLSGIVREPPPTVAVTSMPSLSEPGDEVDFRAPEGGLQIVYFGYTNCPDVCPTSLFDLTVALRMLPEEKSALVDTVMVTVDPDRDLDLLTDYVQSFIPDAAAAGTTDDAVLMAVADPFGVTYDVRALDDGTIEVDHSPFLYVVDDRGELVLTWQFGAPSEEMAADLFQLLETRSA